MTRSCSDGLPVAPWMAEHTLRLPGTVPIAARPTGCSATRSSPSRWPYRDRLIAERPEAVHAMAEAAGRRRRSCWRWCSRTSTGCRAMRARAGGMRRPDGVVVPLDGPPLVAAGRLVQEDLVVLERPRAGPSTC